MYFVTKKTYDNALYELEVARQRLSYAHEVLDAMVSEMMSVTKFEELLNETDWNHNEACALAWLRGMTQAE